MTALAESILAQSEVLERVLGHDLGRPLATLADARRVWLVGTGTSQHAAELGASMLQGTVDASWSSSASFARHPPRLTDEDGVIVISHTGETAYAQAARSLAREAGARLVSLTGEGPDWPEAVAVAPRERSETYTFSYTAVLLALARLADGLGARGYGADVLARVPPRVAAAAAVAPVAFAEPWPERVWALVGSGPGAVTAREGALKLREAARVIAEGFEAEYLLHGSAVPLGAGDGLLVVAPSADPDGLLGALAATAASEGIAVARIEEPPGLPDALAQIPLTVRLQVLASELADARGVDPDVVISKGWYANRLWERGAPR